MKIGYKIILAKVNYYCEYIVKIFKILNLVLKIIKDEVEYKNGKKSKEYNF